jgi:hypothetical protein
MEEQMYTVSETRLNYTCFVIKYRRVITQSFRRRNYEISHNDSLCSRSVTPEWKRDCSGLTFTRALSLSLRNSFSQ